MNSEAVIDLRHEADAIDKFSERVTFFLKTVRNDVSLAGKPA